MKKKLKYIIISLITMPIIFFSVYLIFGIFDNKLEITKYEYTNSKIPDDFNNYSIVQLSDVHSRYFGQNQEDLIEVVTECKPDLILLTGDIIDRKNVDYQCVAILFEKLTLIAPVYAINGNHELDSTTIRDNMNELYTTYGVTLLDNKSSIISKGNSNIQVAGLKHWGAISCKWTPYYIEKNLAPLDDSTFGILLNHRSDMLSYFTNSNYSLILSGHTHGGIIRLPYVGGVINNDATLFPKYDSGVYTEDETTLIVNRGLGNSNIIPRIYNPPEVVNIILKSM